MQPAASRWAVAAMPALLAISVAFADPPAITSILTNGRLTWTDSATSGYHEVQWAPALAEPWLNGWDSLKFHAATGGSTTVTVPMFYRVVRQDGPPYWMRTSFEHSPSTPCEADTYFMTTNISKTAYPGSLFCIIHYCGGSNEFVQIPSTNTDFVTSSGIFGNVHYQAEILQLWNLRPDYIRIVHSYDEAVPKTRTLYAESIGTGNGLNALFHTNLTHYPIFTKLMELTDGVETFVDTGTQPIPGDRGGVLYLNYLTGEIRATFFDAPPVGRSIICRYWYAN